MNRVSLLRTTSDNKDFRSLILELDKDLRSRYEERQSIYEQYNKIENNQNVIVAYDNENPVGCGCFKRFDTLSVEIKRMYVQPLYRRQRIAAAVLTELENWAKELGFTAAVLETGTKQPEAIHLYERCGYVIIDNYGPYVGMENSVCM